jgi:glycosyltransferase involved in cell wall biosynthesis
MKILYDISVLGIGYNQPRARTGIFRVTENLAIGLANSEKCDLRLCTTQSLFLLNETMKYILSSKGLEEAGFVHPDQRLKLYSYAEKSIVKINESKQVRLDSKVLRRALYYIMQSLDKNTQVLNSNDANKADVFHSPYHPLPEYLESQKIKRILTVHDLIPILHPQFFEFKEDDFLKKTLSSLHPEDWVTCVSQATKDDLCNHLNTINPAQVRVTHLAASELFYPCRDPQRIKSVKTKYQIPDGATYILSLSTLEPRKNIDFTIRCFAKLVGQENIEDLYLVIVGTKGWDYEKIFKELSDLKTLQDRIIITGYVADEDLPPLYSGSMAFIYPSFYEGFGLPPLEAMQCGVPVITSNTSSLPEVVGDAGIMVSPTDSDALCQSMLDLYKQPSLREVMSSKSIEQAKRFSWLKFTQETVNTYESALST